MQESGAHIAREAARHLPGLLAELLGEPRVDLQSEPYSPDRGVDFAADVSGRRVLFEVKSSSRPNVIGSAAEQLRVNARPDDVLVLVVPYMTPAGARAAAERAVNWVDLSGNARIRDKDLYVNVAGRPNRYRSRGRPSSPFAPKSARVTRVLLLEPSRWWRQRDLAQATGLDDGNVSRIVGRLDQEMLLEQRGRELRPRDPGLLLDAWAHDYRFDRHDILSCHLSGSGIDLARGIGKELDSRGIRHAFTGLAAAWAIDRFASFRLSSVYVEEDPRVLAEQLGARQNPTGANVQLVGPNDIGVFTGEQRHDELNCVSPVQVYLDLQHLPERADEAAGYLRTHHLNQHANSG
jgi:Transcriptional regulator, AbiEi antitoxin, Type IV TA system